MDKLEDAIKTGDIGVVSRVNAIALNNTLPCGLSPLLHAIQHGQLEAVQCLLDKHESHGITIPGAALEAAIKAKHSGIVEVLLSREKDVTPTTATRDASSNKNLLSIAVQAQSVDILKVLVQYGVDVNCGDALHEACKMGWTEGIDCLLELGANPIARSSDYMLLPFQCMLQTEQFSEDSFNKVVLASLSKYSQDDCCLYPVASMALDAAMKAQNSSTLKSCLQHVPRNIINQTKDCQMPYLHQAVMNDWLDGARLLLQHGADPQLLNDQHRTPLMLATLKTNSSHMTNLLLQMGANSDSHSSSVSRGRRQETQSLVMEMLHQPNPNTALYLLASNCDIDHLIYSDALHQLSASRLLYFCHGLLSCGYPLHRMQQLVHSKLNKLSDSELTLVEDMRKLITFLSTPLPLKMQCRIYIKRYFGPRGRLCAHQTRAQRGNVTETWRINFYYAVCQLPLPQPLKNYLMLGDLLQKPRSP